MSNRNDQHTPHRAERPRVRPVRRPTRAERGTVLLMVVGVLALLAIIAVVYATLGRSDRASTAALVRQQRLDDQAEDVANYLAQVIGDGVFSTYVERDETGLSYLRRSGSDIPLTDENFVSLDLSAPGVLGAAGLPGLPATGPANSARVNEPYSPTGASRFAFPNANTDRREHGASFLASLSPVWLGHIQNNNAQPANDPLRRRRDWMHISNFAPSGNFINLAYLRNNFRAESGFGTDADGRPRLSSRLSLFNPADGAAYTNGSDTVAYTSTGTNRPPHPAIPADWTNNQVWSFRPMVDAAHAPQDPEYLFNQWTDADGDGFADARWFELTDITRAWTGATSQPTSVIPANGRMRLFVAARCIDASGLINVTTATDFARHPGQVRAYPATPVGGSSATLGAEEFARDNVYLLGASPADIDARRAFSMTDFSYEFGQDYGGGMSGFTRPRYNTPDTNDPRDYSGITELPAARLGSAGYLYLQRSLAREALMINPDYALFGRDLQVLFDRTAAGSAQGRITREDERVLPLSGPLLTTSRLEADLASSTITPLSPDLRYLSYLHYGYRPQGSTAQESTRLFFSGFGMADELELRTRQGVNDPDNTSRLELAFGGRSPAAGNLRSPFRDERPLGVEMAGRTMTVNQLFGPTNPNDTTATARQVIATLFGDVRSHIGTVSGARPLIDAPASGTLTAKNDLAYDLTPDLQVLRRGAGVNAVNRDRALQNVLDFYFDCLLPFRSVNGLNYPSLWKDPASFPAARGLAYAESPEIAFRCALHMAVGLADAIDEDGTADATNTSGALPDNMQPTAISVEIAPGEYNGISSAGSGDPKNLYPWLNASTNQPFKPTVNEVRPANVADVVGSRVINVFGVEPQPFLIEYGAFFIFSDAPDSVTGSSPDPDPVAGATAADDATFFPLKVSTKPQLSNADLIGEVFFFQVTNPFDDAVTLYDIGNDVKSRPIYYVQFANRCFIFGEQEKSTYGIVQNTIRLQPGETRTFYALNPGTQKQLEERIRRLHNARPSPVPNHAPILTDGFMDRWFDDQFGTDALQVPMVYPQTFQPVGDAILSGGSPSTTADGESIDLFGADVLVAESSGVHSANPPRVATDGERKSALLWRVMRAERSRDTSVFPNGDRIASGDNDPENDLLADRLRDPSLSSEGAIYSLLDNNGGSDVDIAGTEAGDENGMSISSSPKQISDVQDNTGFTYTLWASIRRPTDAQTNADSGYVVTDTTLGTNRPVRGVLPPWCLEAKSDQAYDVTSGTVSGGGRWSLNKDFESSPNDQGGEGAYPGYSGPGSLDPTAATPKDRFRTVGQFVASTTPIIPEIKQSAYLKDGNPILKSSSLRSDGTGGSARKRYIEVAPEFHFVGLDDRAGPRTLAVDSNTNVTLTRTSRNGLLFSRIGDMLLPLAVGPWSDPVGGSVSGDWQIQPASPAPHGWAADAETLAMEYGWTTLGESIALATGYYSPTSGPGSSVGVNPSNLYYEFGIDDPTNPSKVAKTERGCLRLDKFTPYRADSAGNVIEPIGLGIPFALNVISRGRVEYGVGTSMSAGRATGLTRGAAFGGLDKAVPGVINLNTVSVDNARCLPLVSPMPELAAFNPDFAPSWATQKMDLTYMGGAISIPSARLFDQTNRPDDAFDLAITLVAYRDKMTLDTRPKDPNNPNSRIPVSFQDSTDPTGRNTATGFTLSSTEPARVREARGFKSIGEVLMANFRNPDGSNTYDGRNQSMTRLGEPLLDGSTPPPSPLSDPFVSARIEQPGIVASRYYNRQANGRLTPPVGTVQPLFASDVPDSYAGKIAIANALAGTASVRSDVFICWFVVQGYLPEDTQVEDDAPMVPSVAKRFVMVVDRSNVTTLGEKPRVLMFKEVPMSGN